jgi:predicted transcriptional regulator
VQGVNSPGVFAVNRRGDVSTLTINIPESLHDRLREAAEQDNSTPEHLAVLAIAEKLSSLMTVRYLEERAARAKLEKFEALLSKVPAVEPEEQDRL